MVERIKLFIKTHLLFVVIACAFVFSFLIMFLLGIFSSKKVYTKVTQKVDNVIDKASNKINDYDSRVQEIKIIKKIEENKVEEKKKILESELKLVKNISDRKKRLKKLIELNKSIEVK